MLAVKKKWPRLDGFWARKRLGDPGSKNNRSPIPRLKKKSLSIASIKPTNTAVIISNSPIRASFHLFSQYWKQRSRNKLPSIEGLGTKKNLSFGIGIDGSHHYRRNLKTPQALSLDQIIATNSTIVSTNINHQFTRVSFSLRSQLLLLWPGECVWFRFCFNFITIEYNKGRCGECFCVPGEFFATGPCFNFITHGQR